MMKPLVIITARGGSKGLPGKNIKLLNGKPLIQYTIEAAREVFKDERICISTDDQEIAAVAESTGLKIPFLRPAELASDTSSSYDVIMHAISFYESAGLEFDTVVLLQPTSPLRQGKHIQEAIGLYSPELDMVVSVKESHANPYFNLFEEQENGFLQKSKEGLFTRRQDCPKVYEYNGAIYVMNTESLKKQAPGAFQKVRKYIMDEFSSIDVDTKLDFEIIRSLVENNESRQSSKQP